jgi:hypothetical protein
MTVNSRGQIAKATTPQKPISTSRPRKEKA